MDRVAALRALDLDPGADLARGEIKRAFRREVLKSHPDLPGGDARRFLEIKAAYELLTGRAIAPSAPAARARPRRSGPAGFDFGDLDAPEAGSAEPEDLQDLWREIGYNPFTGEALGEQDADAHAWADQAFDHETPRRSAPRGVRVTEVPRDFKDPHNSGDPALYSAVLPLLLLALLAMQAVMGLVQGPPDAGELTSTGSAELRAGTVPAPPPQARVEAASGLEYAVAVSVAKKGAVPVLAAGVFPSPSVLRAWLEQPEQQGSFQALFPTKVGQGEQAAADDPLLERLWLSQGRHDRERYFADAVLSALREPAPAASAPAALASQEPAAEQDGEASQQRGRWRFHSVAVVARDASMAGLVNRLMDEDRMQIVDVDTAQAWEPGSPMYATKSGRQVMRLVQPITGQEVILVGASPLEQSFVVGAEMRDPVGKAVPELRKLLRHARPSLVALDLSQPALVELRKDILALLGGELDRSVEIMDPTSLKTFKPPAWAVEGPGPGP